MRWITAADLDAWADTIPARTEFPRLVSDLLLALSPDITSIRFPNGDKGETRGFDGVLETAGVRGFVPDGKSVWEFGTTKDVYGKADGDYKTRTEGTTPDQRGELTFVFVTPRTPNHPTKTVDEWLRVRRGVDGWKDVLFIAGTELEHWLQKCPAVSLRHAGHMLAKVPQHGVRSTDDFWDEYSRRFNPPLAEAVVLAGRSTQAHELIVRLREQQEKKLSYAADSVDEVLAFAVAAIRAQSEDVRAFLESKTVVVETEDAVHQLKGRDDLIYLARGHARGLCGLLTAKCPTVVSTGASERLPDRRLLPRPSSIEFGKGLMDMGFSEADAYEEARRCGRSLSVLARRHPSGPIVPPQWLQFHQSLMPALLAGAWSVAVDGDKRALQTLANKPSYADVEQPLRQFKAYEDSPLELIGDAWTLVASIDAFVNLGIHIGQEHLDQFQAVAKAVFSDLIPPPSADEPFDPTRRRGHEHSNWLRTGLMHTLLHMASLHEAAQFTIAGTTPVAFVEALVRALPGLSSDARLMTSLADNLPLLAEAAPRPFLEALEQFLEGDANELRGVFIESKAFFAPTSPHVYLLWALEVLAWNPTYLTRSANILAKLIELDPGGTSGNRPINSLREVFLPWSPSTTASTEQRIAAIRSVLASAPNVSWKIVEALLPRFHDSANSTLKPKFWDTSSSEVLTYGLVWKTQSSVIEMAIELVGLEPERWERLVHSLPQLQADAFERVVSALDEALARSEREFRRRLWETLSKEVRRQKSFKGSLPVETMEVVGKVLDKYEPNDELDRDVWLFDDWMPPAAESDEEAADPSAAIEKARLNALRRILEREGVDGLIRLAKRAKLPGQMSTALFALNLEPEQVVDFIAKLWEQRGETFNLLRSFVAHSTDRFGISWIQDFASHMSTLGADEKVVGELLSSTSDSREIWTEIANLGPAVEEQFWLHKHVWMNTGSTDDLLFCIDKLVAAGRPLPAMQGTYRRIAEIPTTIIVTLLRAAIDQIAALESVSTMTTYYVEKFFDELRKRSDIGEQDIAQLELLHLPLFSRTDNLTIQGLLLRDPDLFVEALSMVFRSSDEEVSETTAHQRGVATRIYQVLSGITKIPGQSGQEVDFEALMTWCTSVRRLADGKGLARVADSQIGQILAHAPFSDEDTAWPHIAVRKLLEDVQSGEIENGIEVGRFNLRGAYSKAIGEGGKQERELAVQYRTWSTASVSYPRTHSMLMRIADSWDYDAQRADIEAKQDEYR